ncbi:MAG: hypothetical protein KJ043_15385 [Anaerolineae bacterium]|nr:hypothetical protein [Anaerolineae bacterium]
MIDPRIIQALSNSDPDKRKKAVAYLAKSLDRDALPHLARVYKTDGDPEIRELAKKAGAYIQKNAPQTATAYDDDETYSPYDSVYADDEPAAETSYSRYSSLYADDDEDDDIASSAGDDVPMPSNIQVSPVAEERAKAFVEQAMDWNVRGKNDKAIEMLGKAFKTNPRLLYDSYTISLATNITGLSPDDIRRRFAVSPQELEKSGMIPKGTVATSRKLNAIQQLFALIVFIGATSVLIGFFALPWVDFGWIPIPADEFNQLGGLGNLGDLQSVGVNVDNFNTFGGAVGEFQKLLNRPEIRELEGQASLFGAQGDLIRDFLGGLRSIRTGASGMDTMMYMIGSQDALRAFFGLGGLIDVILDALDDPMFADLVLNAAQSQFGDLGALGVDAGSLNPDAIRAGINIGLAQLKYTPQAVDFSVIAVPVAGSLAFLFALMLYMTPNMIWWVLNILVGLIGVGACAYFYTTGINNLMMLGGSNVATSLNDFGIAVTSSNQFIGIGFWISMGGMIAVAIAPFLGMLFAPAKQNA